MPPVLKLSNVYPTGTTVEVHPAPALLDRAPVTTPYATAVMADGGLDLPLFDGRGVKAFALYGLVAAAHRWVSYVDGKVF